jgi:hypothetical protein
MTITETANFALHRPASVRQPNTACVDWRFARTTAPLIHRCNWWNVNADDRNFVFESARPH